MLKDAVYKSVYTQLESKLLLELWCVWRPWNPSGELVELFSDQSSIQSALPLCKISTADVVSVPHSFCNNITVRLYSLHRLTLEHPTTSTDHA